MSHFLVAVVGDDPYERLRPFQEFDMDDEFAQMVDVTDSQKRSYEAYVGREKDKGQSNIETFKEYLLNDGMTELPHDTEIDSDEFTESDTCQSSRWFFIVTEIGDVDRVYHYTNPNSKWDWCALDGGRWRTDFIYKNLGAFKAKCKEHDIGNTEGMMPKSCYDFEAMRNAAVDQENKRWDMMESILETYQWEPWESVLKRFANNTEKARMFYLKQEDLQQASQLSNIRISDLDMYITTDRQAAVENVAMRAIPCWAVVKDGQWFERGKMGWWGESFDDMPIEEWYGKVNAMFDALPDDTVLTFVDCHI